MKKVLTIETRKALISTLKHRFENNKARHKKLEWDTVQARLERNPEKLWCLNEMEITGGEPDVVDYDKDTGEVIFYDCAAESPKGRRSLCYDQEALATRKLHKPKNNALDLAAEIGIEIMTEAQYRHLQTLGSFDAKTSSWLLTPPAVRTLGGAYFGDFRYGSVFIYHNGAESYYAARGFRGTLTI